MKVITISSQQEAVDYENKLKKSSHETKLRIGELGDSLDDLRFLRKLKFDPIGLDPLDCTRELNVIEQINQTFTYLASFRAAQILFKRHKDINSVRLNLGTTSGSDIESDPLDLVACEVFAATRPGSNNKLNKDVDKVLKTTAKNKYVFFICPGIAKGIYPKKEIEGVVIWSLGI